ncbi:hypothetical protein DPMN_084702 [Dreissena polymorpha]|uniref:Mpv17-like protein 2 n=1 Tax=Dreissena polymorpha TaxID=45954 RepID=A0A9D3YC98_DREPO|nr:hypothetical protein DPMN_084702 [Dreissena polymorpha]
MSKFQEFTKKLFSKYMLATNTATTCALLGLGDYIVQNIERLDHKDAKYDFHRTGRMMSMGFLYGPMSHVWYKILDGYLPATNLRTVAKKIVVDQAVAGPIFCSAFFMGMSLLEGKTVKHGVDEVKSKFLIVYMIDWCVWPPAQFMNFSYLGPQYRVVYCAFITLIWNCILSWMKHKDIIHDHSS